jgi:tRNA 5-methylaminomethyl-2-thiouridine biosynthesis bifunctional protein
MQAAGFSVNKVSGSGNKRESLVAELGSSEPATLKYRDKPWFKRPLKTDVSEKQAVIIGAGIAGLSLAYTLVKRGWTVTIIDRHGEQVKEATSNPAPVVYPRLSVNNDVDTEFFTAAYYYALYVFKTLQHKSRQRFWFGDGLIQTMDRNRITQIINKFQFNDGYISVDDNSSEQASVHFPSAGVLLPAVLCDVLKNECGDKIRIIHAEVTAVKHDGKLWHCLSGSQLVGQSEILTIANGTGINALALPLSFPVEAIRGQVVELNANPASHHIKKTVNAAVHITPVINGKHYLGASYTRHSARLDLDIDPQENRQLLASLNDIFPDMFSADDYSGSWAGVRTMSKDRAPIVGAVPDEDFYNREYADICHGKVNKAYQPARYLKGLYITAAHGSRGFTSSFLCSQIIASLIEGEPAPVLKRVLDYLHPSRFTVNKLKRG